MKHARLSPSSSSRWLSCTASVEVGDKYENKSNSASEWGTNVHYIGEQLLTDHFISVGDTLMEPERNPFTVDAEMLQCAEDYADYCRALMKPDSIILIEEQFDLSFISEGQFGTGDFSVANGTHLDIVDLKTGHGIVWAEENTQLMLYALGAVHELEDYTDIETITLHIMQSRANHIDTWTTTIEELFAFEAYAKGQADIILSGETTFNPTTKGCQWCPHSSNCEALRSHVDDVMTGSFENLDAIEGKANLISDSHIENILNNKDLIISFIKAVEESALERVSNGTLTLTGFKLVRARKNKAWLDKEAAEKYLVRKLKQKGAYKQTLITPTQAVKALGKGHTTFIEKLFGVPEGEIILAPESDKREAISAVCEDFDELS